MEYYGNNDWRDYNNPDDYLSHHGVLGMKWGVRRYQPYSIGYQREGGAGGKEVGEAKGSKSAKPKKTTGFVKRMGIRIQARGLKKATSYMNARSAKGFNRKVSAIMGNKRRESNARIDSRKESKLADASRTRLFKRIHETRAANRSYAADYYAKKQKQSLGRRAFESAVVNSTLLKTPYQRYSGRKTTVGREIANRVLTAGIAGYALDAKYLRAKSKTPEARAARIAAKEKKYQNKINKINTKSDAYIGKLNSARAKNRARLEARYDKKISKTSDAAKRTELSSAKRASLKDFDAGTKYFNKANKNIASNRTKYLEMKKKAASDKSIKNTTEYKEAQKNSRKQILSDLSYGKSGSVLKEAGRLARDDFEKKKKKSSK